MLQKTSGIPQIHHVLFWHRETNPFEASWISPFWDIERRNSPRGIIILHGPLLPFILASEIKVASWTMGVPVVAISQKEMLNRQNIQGVKKFFSAWQAPHAQDHQALLLPCLRVGLQDHIHHSFGAEPLGAILGRNVPGIPSPPTSAAWTYIQRVSLTSLTMPSKEISLLQGYAG